MGDEPSEAGTTGTCYHYCLFEGLKTTPCPEGELPSSTDRKDGVTGSRLYRGRRALMSGEWKKMVVDGAGRRLAYRS